MPCSGSLCALDANGALLEVGLKGYWISGIKRHLVNELAFVEPRHEYDATWHAVASARLKPGANGPPRRDSTFTSSPRRILSLAASSGCMKHTASGNAR